MGKLNCKKSKKTNPYKDIRIELKTHCFEIPNVCRNKKALLKRVLKYVLT